MRKNIVLAMTVWMLAPYAVLAAEVKETPEIDPAGLPQQQQTPPQQQPQAYPSDDAAPQQPQQYPQQQYPQPQQDQPQPEYQPPQQQPQFPQGFMPSDYAPQPPPQQPQYGEGFPPQQPQYSGSPFYAGRTGYNYNLGGPTSYTGYAQQPSYGYPQFGPPGQMLHPRVATAPQGLTIPVTLQTAISTQVAKNGDFVQAQIAQNVPLSGLSYIPQGAVITGQVTEAQAGRMMERSGSLGVEFNKLQLPDGRSVAIQAHVLGNIGKYQDKNGEYRGEGFGTKLANFGLRAALGAGSGAALGTALGAITGRVGTGAWAGTAIGGGIGVVDDLFLRKGRNVLIQSGTPMQIQLDAPVEVPVDIQPQYGQS